MATQSTDPNVIEHRLLEFAYTTDAKITVTALAYFVPCSIEDAARVLDDLAARDRLNMEIEDDGTVVYHLRGRQRLEPRAVPPRALVPVPRSQPAASPLLAGALSLFIPGAGHLYAGRAVAAVLWFLAVSLGYVLIVPGLVLHLFSIASAAASAHRLNARALLQLDQANVHLIS